MRTRFWVYLEWKLRDAGYTVANISYPSLFLSCPGTGHYRALTHQPLKRLEFYARYARLSAPPPEVVSCTLPFLLFTLA
jgi:hypothetical protein